MKCTELAARIERLCPEAEVRDVARLCLLLANSARDFGELADDKSLVNAWSEMDSQFRAATAQHAAISMSIDADECEEGHVTPEQIWRLVDTIRAQSRILQFYMGLGS